jgi:hypothetical protein
LNIPDQRGAAGSPAAADRTLEFNNVSSDKFQYLSSRFYILFGIELTVEQDRTPFSGKLSPETRPENAAEPEIWDRNRPPSKKFC